jgi:hypothetical protein
MRHPLSASGRVTPQPPGAAPRGAALRASGTAHPPGPGPLRCPGGEDTPPEAREAPQGRPPAMEARI